MPKKAKFKKRRKARAAFKKQKKVKVSNPAEDESFFRHSGDEGSFAGRI